MTPDERAAFWEEAEAGIQRLRDTAARIRAELEAQRAAEAERQHRGWLARRLTRRAA